ncbi:MAG: class I SAM-dependent methyltransferase, partial [Gammaproteobacteria bacterium]|nr:class I SAM-dependent methyltransferase [Gammaproteobacteria bacterium]
DATKPFTVRNGSDRAYQFDAVTAWEFIEHISEKNLPGVMGNIIRHLKPGGLVFGTTTDLDYVRLNLHYHQTLKPIEWWIDYFSHYNINYDRDLAYSFRNAWLRNGKYKLAMRYTPTEEL